MPQQNLCIGSLLTEKDIAKAEKKAAEKAATASSSSEDSKAEGKADGGEGGETGEEEKVDLTVAQLQKMSATGRDVLSRTKSIESTDEQR